MSSLYTIGLMNELADAFEADGYTSEMVKMMTSHGRLTAMKAVLEGRAEIRMLAPKPIPPLLHFLGTKTFPPATTEKFVASKKFVRNISRNAKPKISFIGDNFTAWFLGEDGVVEEPRGEVTLGYGKLTRRSLDTDIIAELGGDDMKPTLLLEIFSAMEGQPNGEEGVLLNNGWANIFYALDKKGILRVVLVGWYGDGWYVCARESSYPSEWVADYRVFSRNLVPLVPETLSQA